MKYIITEKQYRLVMADLISEQKFPPSLMKLFGAQTTRNVEKIFANQTDNIESFFGKLISAEEKILMTKGGQQYFRSSIGVDVPASTIKSLLDLATSGKMTKANMEQYVSLLPEKFIEGSEFRNNIRKLLTGIIERVEQGVGKSLTQTKGVTQTTKKTAQATAPVIAKGSFKVADPEESFKIAGWLDQKFYESGSRRHSELTDREYSSLIPETKSYLLTLLDYLKNYHPNFKNGNFYDPSNNKISKTERELLDRATMNIWGGYGRPGGLVRMKLDGGKTPPLPIPTKAVEDNLNSVFPTASNSMYGNGENLWTSVK